MKHHLVSVHSYINTLRYLLSELGETLVDTPEASEALWVPFRRSYADHTSYPAHQAIVYVWHGGDSHSLSTRSIEDGHFRGPLQGLNVVMKRPSEYIRYRIAFPDVNSLLLLGKYHAEADQFSAIHQRRQGRSQFNFPFIMLNHNFSSHEWGKQQFNALSSAHRNMIHLFGASTPGGNVRDVEVFPQAKFSIFIKQGGYLCNFPIRSLLCGIPVIMRTDLYEREYSDIFPRFPFILCRNFSEGIEQALSLTVDEYLALTEQIWTYAQLSLMSYSSDDFARTRVFIRRLRIGALAPNDVHSSCSLASISSDEPDKLAQYSVASAARS